MKIPHLEKVFLIISIIIFGILTYILTTDKNNFIIEEINYNRFEIKSKSGGSYFLFSQPLSIMPGEFLHVYDLDNKLQDKYEVKSVLGIHQQACQCWNFLAIRNRNKEL